MRHASRIPFQPVMALAAAAAILFFAPHSAVSQILFGSLVGNVTDPSGAPIAGASVVVTNEGTNQTWNLKTNEVGSYTLQSINPGTYSVTVNAAGFTTFTLKGLDLLAGATVRADAALKVGAIAEKVEVNASAIALQTDSVDVRHEIPSVELASMPLPLNRNYQGMVSTLPGWLPPESGGPGGLNPSGSMTINGNGGTSQNGVNGTSWRIDGAVTRNGWTQQQADMVPALDSIESVNVSTGVFDAENGYAATGTVSVQLKSGTNELHGTAYWFHNDQHLKATPYFNPANVKKPVLIYNQAGGTVGGPIKKNKLFYFVSYDGTFDRSIITGYATVPSARMRTGDMSQSPTVIYDPLTGNPGGSGRTAFPNKIIPSSRISPITQKIMDRTPLPNLNDGATPTNDYWATGPYAFNRDQIDSKFNWNVNQKLTVNGRFSYLNFYNLVGAVYPDLGGNPINSTLGAAGKSSGWVSSQTYSFVYAATPHMVIDGYFGYSGKWLITGGWLLDKNYGLDYLGIPGTNGKDAFSGGFPKIQATGFGNFGSAGNPTLDQSGGKQFSISGSWIKGNHDLRFGFDSVLTQLDFGQPMGDPGSFYFTQAVTSTPGASSGPYNTYSSFELGLAQNIAKTGVWATGNAFAPDYSAYIRDRWQISRRLTASLGLRWDYFPTPTRRDGGFPMYDPNTNVLTFCGYAGVSVDSCGYTSSKRLFSPRIGLAYRITEHTVFRVGYGITFDPQDVARNLVKWYPTTSTYSASGNTSYDYYENWAVGLPALSPPDLGTGRQPLPNNLQEEFLNPHYRRDYVQSWNATVQREFGKGWVGDVAYVASATRRMYQRWDMNYSSLGGGNASRVLYKYNQPNAITLDTDNGLNAEYNSLQASLQKRFASRYLARFSYTHARFFEDNTGYPNPAYWGLGKHNPSPNDRPQLFNAVFSADSPFGRNQRWATSGVLSKILGGWQLSGVYTYASGPRFTVTSGTGSLNAPGVPQTANQVLPSVDMYNNPASWFNPLAYRSVTTVAFGNSGNLQLRAPGLSNIDTSLIRNIRVHERYVLQVRAQALNTTNTPHFAQPGTNVDNMSLNPDGTVKSLGGFSTVTAVQSYGRNGVDERQIMLGIHLSF